MNTYVEPAITLEKPLCLAPEFLDVTKSSYQQDFVG
jgi:hypothetical protein